jgi:hypothetical protein
MSLLPSQAGFRMLAGVCVGLLAVAVLCPSRALAGCSPYVITGNTHVGMLSSRLDVPHLTDAASAQTAAKHPLPSRPCSGALCSGKPAVPVPLPIVSPETRGEHWGELLSAPTAPQVEGRWRERAETLLQPIVEGPSIDHPPRMAGVSLF